MSNASVPVPSLDIAGQRIGEAAGPVYLIAEIGLAHDGSLGTAMALVDAAADAGADAVKFQIHIADAESTVEEPFRVRFSHQDESRMAYWRRTAFSPQAWRALLDHARGRGLSCIASPFSVDAVALARQLGVDAFKIASGEVGHEPLCDAIADGPEPVLASLGLATEAETDALVDKLRGPPHRLGLFHCVSEYPTPASNAALGLVPELKQRYRVPVGLSDHSGSPAAGIAAVALGADLIEFHITLSKAAFGPDVPASLTPEDARRLRYGCDYVRTALAHATALFSSTPAKAAMRQTFGRSLAPRRDLPAGHRLTLGDLSLKKPAGGLPWSARDRVVGRRLRRAVSADRRLQESDLEDEH